MEKEITLKHLSAYLPYELVIIDSNNTPWLMTTFNLKFALSSKWKPQLIHMDDLSKEELIDYGFGSHIDFLTHEKRSPLRCPYEMTQYLFSQHYDVFGLIDSGLAIRFRP